MPTDADDILLHVPGGAEGTTLQTLQHASVPPWTRSSLVQHVVWTAVGRWAPRSIGEGGPDLLRRALEDVRNRPAIVEQAGRLASADAVRAVIDGEGADATSPLAMMDNMAGLPPILGDEPVMGVVLDDRGVLSMTFGAAHRAFERVFQDSVGALAPLGHPAGYSTHFIDVALARLQESVTTDERVLVSGNSTALIREPARIRAESSYELFDPQWLPADVVANALLAYRQAVEWTRRVGPMAPPVGGRTPMTPTS